VQLVLDVDPDDGVAALVALGEPLEARDDELGRVRGRVPQRVHARPVGDAVHVDVDALPVPPALADKRVEDVEVALASSSGFATGLLPHARFGAPARHAASTVADTGTRSQLNPRRATSSIVAFRFTAHSPWKTSFVVSNPNQFSPVSRTARPPPSTILLQLVE
jgi:hypothetical protein